MYLNQYETASAFWFDQICLLTKTYVRIMRLFMVVNWVIESAMGSYEFVNDFCDNLRLVDCPSGTLLRQRTHFAPTNLHSLIIITSCWLID